MSKHTPDGWRAAAACLSADPDLFYPISAGRKVAAQIVRARQICAGCQVRRQCLEFALEMKDMEGIWGGTTPEQRVRTRREELRRQVPRDNRSSVKAIAAASATSRKSTYVI